MARKSGWQQFAENFRTVYDTTTGFMRDLDEQRAMNAPVDAGLTPEQQRDVKYQRLADTKAKWGDYEGSLKLQSGLLDQKARQQAYDFNTQRNPLLLRAATQEADLAGKKLDSYDTTLQADLESKRASTAASRASAAAAQALVEQRGLQTKEMRRVLDEENTHRGILAEIRQEQDPIKRAELYRRELEKKLPGADITKRMKDFSAEEAAATTMKMDVLGANLNEIMTTQGPLAAVQWLDQVNGKDISIRVDPQPDGSLAVIEDIGGKERTVVTAPNERELGVRMGTLFGSVDGLARLSAHITAQETAVRKARKDQTKARNDMYKEVIKAYAASLGSGVETPIGAKMDGLISQIDRITQALPPEQSSTVTDILDTYGVLSKSEDPEDQARAQQLLQHPIMQSVMQNVVNTPMGGGDKGKPQGSTSAADMYMKDLTETSYLGGLVTGDAAGFEKKMRARKAREYQQNWSAVSKDLSTVDQQKLLGVILKQADDTPTKSWAMRMLQQVGSEGGLK